MAFWNAWRKEGAKLAEMQFAIERRLDRLEILSQAWANKAHAVQVAQEKESRSAKDEGSVKAWLPVLARMQEVTLAAMGHPDMAREFGLVDRQREAMPVGEPETEWTELQDGGAEEDGITYGQA